MRTSKYEFFQDQSLESALKSILLMKTIDFDPCNFFRPPNNSYLVNNFLNKISYDFSVKAVITREVRSYLKTFADKISVEVFAKNLKQLLLMRPVKGQKILGIDPGFRYGCKLALISEQNAVLATTTIYPHARDNKSAKLDIAEQILAALLKKHGLAIFSIIHNECHNKNN